MTSVGVVHLAFLGDVACACTNIQQVTEEEEEEVTFHVLTDGAMRECGLTSIVVCINDKIYDIRERNVTLRNEI